MCNKGNPSTTTNQSGTSTTSQSGTSSGQQAGTSSQVLGPTPETLALYMQLLNQAQGVADPANFNPNTLVQTAPWTDAMNQAVNAQWALGQQGMGFVPEAAAALGQGAQSTVGQIPGVAASLLSPWAGQAVDFGMQQGQALGNFGLTQGQAIGDWATSNANRIMSEGPQLQDFSKAAVEQYMSPYTQDVVDATQGWFNNQNSIQGNQLIGQAIKQGNAFGGDRAGVAQGVLAGQQQLAQAPVIAGLYNQGYAQALAEFNQQNALAAQLQQFGSTLGLQGLTAQGQLGMQGLQGQGQLGMAGLGMGLQASTAANQQAIAALGQNQNAALQAGQGYGQLGATQFGSNLAGGGQAINAANVYPSWLQNLMNMQAGNAATMSAYPFQTTSWYGGLLGGLGPLTGSQQAGSNASISQQQQNQLATQIAQQSGITTPPQPNQFVQAAGLGLAGLGMFLKDGGSVPHMAEGGGVGPYGGRRAPYERARSYIQDSGMRPGRLKAPDVPGDKPLTLQSLGRALTFLNLGSGSGSKAAAATNAASGGTLGQLGSLFKTEGAKGVAGGLSSFFGGSGGGGSISVDPEEITDVATLRRGGLVSRYADGGWDDEEEDIPEAAQSTIGSSEDSPWSAFFQDMPSDVPMPRSRPDAAAFSDDSYFDSGSEPSVAPPYAHDFRDKNLDPDIVEGGSPAGLPEQAGLGEDETPAFGGGRGGGRGRMLMPGSPRSQPGFMQRWASNPLTQIGLGLASQNSPTALGGIGQGLAKAMPMIQRQHALDQQQEALDRKYAVDNSGMTQTIKFADGRLWDTGLPTPKALQMAQKGQTQRYGRVPTGYRQTAAGEYEPVPGGPQAAQAPKTTEVAPAPGVSGGEAASSKPVSTEGAAISFTPGGDRVTVDPPDPTPVGNNSSDAIKIMAENYVQTGKLPPGLGRDKELRGAVISYGAALVESRGMSFRQASEMWRFAPRQAGWLMGADGRAAGSLGTLIDHLDTMRDLTTALQNGDNQTYNLIKNKVAKWTGSKYPTNVEAGGPIVGAEIMKAVGAAGAGTGVERETAGLNIGDLRKSPEQFAGSIDVVQRLAAGQLRTKYRQAESIGLPKERLKALVGKRADEVLNSLEPEGSAAPSAGSPMAPATAAPAKGTRKQFKQGWGVWNGTDWVAE